MNTIRRVITKCVNVIVGAVMRSCTPPHRCLTDNEQNSTSNGTQLIDAGDKLLSESFIRPPQKKRESGDILFQLAVPAMIISVVVMLVVLVLEILRRIP